MNTGHFFKPLSLGIKNVRKPQGCYVNHKISFEELCPIWAEKLNNGLSEKDKVVLARDSKYCIVGEAWHFSGKYAGYYIAPLIPFVGCWTCIKLARKFGKNSHTKNIQRDQLKPLIEDFMNHWAERHC